MQPAIRAVPYVFQLGRYHGIQGLYVSSKGQAQIFHIPYNIQKKVKQSREIPSSPNLPS